MPEISISWEWKTTSPLHVGSGLSRLGVADSLVQRDAAGHAVIYGEAVKGAIRMGAEQIAAWLGESQHGHYVAQGTAEPVSWPLARLFGRGAARCTPAKLVEPSTDPNPGMRSQVFTATAIDRKTGIADDKTLRKTEVVPPGLRFRAEYVTSVADGEAEVVETLLLAALASVESLGGKAGIGWGSVTLVSVCVKLGGKQHDATASVRPERLQKLECALKDSHHEMASAPEQSAPTLASSHEPGELSQNVATSAPPASAAGHSSSCLQWFRIEITLDEPTCLPDSPEVSNKVTTNDWIAATTVRGSLAAYWRRSGCCNADIASWLSEATAWTPAFRVVEGALAVPAPRSFVTTKRALGEVRPVHDMLSGPFPTANDGTLVQWRSIAHGSIVGTSRPKLAEDKGLRETRMHVARDYRTGGKRSGGLYARESLVAGTKFVCWARVPKRAFRNQPRSLLIGKRISAGNGRATVQVQEVGGPAFCATPASQGQAQSSCEVSVQLLSPAVVYDDHGYPRQTLDRQWWSKEFNQRILPPDGREDGAIRTAPGHRGGWMTNWRHGRAAVTTIDAGSLWRLRCGSPADANTLRKSMRDRCHIGERSYEGFGWIAIDPPWLERSEPKSKLPAESPAFPKALGKPTQWPGINRDAATLACIAGAMMEKRVPEQCGPALRELAGRVRVAQSRDGDAMSGLKNYYVERTERDKKQNRVSKWSRVMTVLPESDKLWEEPEQLLFALSVLVARTREGSE